MRPPLVIGDRAVQQPLVIGRSAVQQPLVIGHRGASGYRPEHTRAAYELAFDQGADAVEPDIVATRDGVLVLRHENEISGTTDVADHPEFAARRTTRAVDGQLVSGWFTEDFTWDELSTLRARERLPAIRTANTAFDGVEPILRLVDLIEMIDAASIRLDRPIGMVAEIKHAHHFGALGLPIDELFSAAIADWAGARPRDSESLGGGALGGGALGVGALGGGALGVGALGGGALGTIPLITESFELGVLDRLRERGVPGSFVFLADAAGAPPDQLADHGANALSFEQHLTTDGLRALADRVHGVSVSRKLLLRLSPGKKLLGTTDLVDRVHNAGLSAYCWTLRAENAFLATNLRGAGGRGGFGDWMTEFRTIYATGVDGVFADQPDLAVAARAAHLGP